MLEPTIWVSSAGRNDLVVPIGTTFLPLCQFDIVNIAHLSVSLTSSNVDASDNVLFRVVYPLSLHLP